jgi:hypothetical membrane protein
VNQGEGQEAGGRLPTGRALKVVMVASVQFVALTTIAMLIYPGGTMADPASPNYRFFANFFSDLGRTIAHGGRSNTFSMVLFVVALGGAGLGLVLFFLVLPRASAGRRSRALARLGSLPGIVSGLAFVGVALTPADRLPVAHIAFVLTAFTAFFVASLLYLAATAFDPDRQRLTLGIWLGFALLLGGYVWLLFAGPRLEDLQSLAVQVTGQKIIAYAAVGAAFAQARGARERLAAG